MITMFRVVTFDNWSEVMYAVMDVYPFAWVYFLSFIFLNAFVFLNMMIGVVIDVFSQEHEKHSKEMGKGEAFEVHDTHELVIKLMTQVTRMEKTMTEYNTTKQ
jgi:voltage-gated sodium channel